MTSEGNPRSRHWTQLVDLAASDVPHGHGRKAHLVRSGGTILEVLVVRDAEGWTAIDTLCPHAGGRFEEALVGGQLARCPLHDLRFDPRTGRCVSEACRPANTFAVRAEGDALFIELPFDAAPLDALEP
ncbi:MAG: Rieske 2Fe-2S domain-containing protein [Planctomycetota bacterium]